MLAEVVGASSSLDGGSLTGPDPAGTAAARTVRQCLEKLGTRDLCVLAHGTGTVLNDEAEAAVLSQAVPNARAVCAFKSRMGHLASACGAAELAVGLVCAEAGRFPAIANLESPAWPDLPLLRSPITLRPGNMLLQSFGFGGQNACLGLKEFKTGKGAA